MVKSIPEGFHSVTPYLSMKGAAAAIGFYKQAFGAEEVFRLDMPNGEVGHAEIRIGDSPLMLSETCEDSPMPSPEGLGGTSVGIYLYVDDVDLVFARAVEAGASVVKAVEDQFYGDRNGTLKDPYGHVWFLATHKEDLEPEEVRRRAEVLFNPDGA